MAAHSSILAWEIPWTEETGGYSAQGCKRVGDYLMIEQQHTKLKILNLCIYKLCMHTIVSFIHDAYKCISLNCYISFLFKNLP